MLRRLEFRLEDIYEAQYKLGGLKRNIKLNTSKLKRGARKNFKLEQNFSREKP